VEWALRRHGREIVERQMALERLADAAGDLFLMAAVVSRAEFGRRADAGPSGEAHVTRARLIVNEAWRRVRRQLGRLREHPDNDVRVVAAEVLASSGAHLPGGRPGE
jgi:hypothetical protein